LLCDIQAYLYAYNNNHQEKIHVYCLGFDSFTKVKLIDLWEYEILQFQPKEKREKYE
jgi:hypothetical protein